ncbi:MULTISPECIES: hypothetical protein [Bradyrhizobium]|uniref:CHAT domain-containing protein n=2 Tax=Bradyrhizobium TaxID=374 RepID=A0A2M8R7J8_9BRAD|nr:MULTISPECIES: hypothetical protein [Bradyrhizobium]MCP3367746.1 hypothetical protein [Bradyrhizobium cajani]MVT73792.1 hypothetical protein [Bradyrhizobium cajani]PJG53797.1 hypothetical protein CVM73_18990 [Bradyrhizobium forestalis]
MNGLGSTPTEEVQITNAQFLNTCKFVLSIARHASVPFTSDSSPKTLERIAGKVRQLPKQCRRSSVEYSSESLANRDKYMAQVLKNGAALFDQVITDAGDRKEFVRMLSAHVGATIRVSGEGACIPWEALCLSGDPDNATYEDFLGWNHVILREVPRKYRPFKLDAEVRRAGFVEDDGLASVHRRDTQLAIDGLGDSITKIPLDPLKKPTDKRLFHGFFYDKEAPKELVQFDCHIEGGDEVHTSHMRVTEKFQLPFPAFHEAVLMSEPVVLLNACGAGTTNWASTDGYAAKLWANGAALVIAAEAALGDGFMTDFAHLFYLMASDGAYAAEALLKARRITLAEHRNPSALFYGLYGEAQFQLRAPPLSATKRAELDLKKRVLGGIWPPKPKQVLDEERVT